MNKEKNSIGNIIELVFKAVALAMAVAVVVTSIMDIMEPESQITMLGIAVFGLAVTALDKD